MTKEYELLVAEEGAAHDDENEYTFLLNIFSSTIFEMFNCVFFMKFVFL